jgi:hypothetical protein
MLAEQRISALVASDLYRGLVFLVLLLAPALQVLYLLQKRLHISPPGPGGLLGHRVPDGEPNAGQVDLPGEGPLRSVDAADLAGLVYERFGARLTVGPVLARAKHAITHHRITMHGHAATLAAGARAIGRLQWFPLAGDAPWTTLARKLFRQALGADGTLRA